MKVSFQSRDPDGLRMRKSTLRRVRFVLRRLAWLVPRATVQLSDINGPGGGVDKRCQVTLMTEGAGTVVITSMAGDWRCAIEDALGRAARTLVRAWQRNRDQGRSVPRALIFDAPDRRYPGRDPADQRLSLGSMTVELIRRK